MLFRSLPLAVACASLLCATSVLAQTARATVEVSGFSFALIDLDPADGIVPAISFTERTSTDSWHQLEGALAEFETRDGHGSTEVIGSGGMASASIGAGSASAKAILDQPGATAYFIQGRFDYAVAFTLTPMTGITFSANALLDAAPHGASMRADATAFMIGSLMPAGADPYDHMKFMLPSNINNGTQNSLLSGYMSTGQEGLTGFVTLTGAATVDGVSPVPEPASWAMLLAGLGLLGWRRRP